jgi:hypothetical protein
MMAALGPDKMANNSFKKSAPKILNSQNVVINPDAGERRNSPAGTAMLVNDFFCDIQVVAAQLFRNGLTEIYDVLPPSQTPGNYPIHGPLFDNLVADISRDLYQSVDCVILWSSGATAQALTTYDPYYFDMTQVVTYSWQAGSTMTNVPPGPPAGFGMISPADPPPIPPGPTPPPVHYFTYAIDPVNQPITFTQTPTTLIWSWPSYDNNNGDGTDTLHYGGTITVTLGNPMAFGDFAAITDGMLAQVALLSPGTKYAGTNGSAQEINLDFCSAYPQVNIPPELGVTNSIRVTLTRAGYQFTGSFSEQNGILNQFFWQFLSLFPVGGNNPTSNLTYISQRTGLPLSCQMQPLAASGLPLSQNVFARQAGVPAPTDCAPVIYSVKSAVLALRPGFSIRTFAYNLSGNSFVEQDQNNIQVTGSPIIYGPANVGGLGYMTANYNLPTRVYPCQLIAGQVGTIDSIKLFSPLVPRGTSFTFTAFGFDDLGYLGDTEQIAAVWSLNPGALGTLMVAPDGKSAIYTAPNVFNITDTVTCNAAGLGPGTVQVETL